MIHGSLKEVEQMTTSFTLTSCIEEIAAIRMFFSRESRGRGSLVGILTSVSPHKWSMTERLNGSNNSISK